MGRLPGTPSDPRCTDCGGPVYRVESTWGPYYICDRCDLAMTEEEAMGSE